MARNKIKDKKRTNIGASLYSTCIKGKSDNSSPYLPSPFLERPNSLSVCFIHPDKG